MPMNNERKNHWEKIYAEKSPAQVSWTQKEPSTSIDFVKTTSLPMDAPIIDVGGGESHLVDRLIELGYSDITVLDISKNALERCQQRLGKKAEKVEWIVADITQFQPSRSYALWHDRAVFHFLTQKKEIEAYKRLVTNYLNHSLILSTFSLKGPLKCSGLPIQQYDSARLASLFAPQFELVHHQEEIHHTPFNTTQAFIYTHFKSKGVE